MKCKHSTNWAFTALSLLMLCAACTQSIPADAPRRELPRVTAAELSDTARSQRQFAFDLFEALDRDPHQNIVFSPLSISQALGIMQAGASGDTAKQLAGVLHLDSRPERTRAVLGALGAHVTRRAPGMRIDVASALWVQRGYALSEEYRRTVAKSYTADVLELDFDANPKAGQALIDSWVSKRTHGKIKRVRISLHPLTRMVVTNAVYFLGDWALPFDEEDTTEQAFYSADGEAMQTPLMHLHGDFAYAETEQMQMLELPYERGELSMVICLPRKRDGLPEVEKLLTAEFDAWMSRLKMAPAEVHLPRFQLEEHIDLTQPIEKLGAPLAFDPGKADFSKASAEKLFIAAVAHSAVVDVNERGTEAAAVTEFDVAAKADRDEPHRFRADHPFLFVIREKKHGSILFIGRLARP